MAGSSVFTTMRWPDTTDTAVTAMNAAIALTIFCITSIASIACYRLFFHPLATHPGPFLARVSAIPNWYHAVKGDRHEWLTKLHLQYGSAVRFTPDSMSFNTVTALSSIYKARTANIIKSDWYQGVQDSAGGFESTFTARQKARHAVKRRLLSHAFSDRALRDYEPRICGLISTWLKCLEQETGTGTATATVASDLNLGDWCSYLIFDILGDLAFGAVFGLSTDPEARSISKLIPRVTRGWYTLGYHPFTKWMRYLLFKTRFGQYLGNESFHDNAGFRSFCRQKIMTRSGRRDKQLATNVTSPPEDKVMETSTPTPSPSPTHVDMFQHLLDGRDPETGKGYVMGDLACECALLMIAGSQSTTGGLSAIFFYLVHHPDKLARLRAEIHDAFAADDAIRYEASSKLIALPYLRACIDESLRLSPPTPGHLPRKIIGGDGIMIDGAWYPPETNVGVSPYVLHRNELYFERPLAFEPERWLADDHDDEDDDGKNKKLNPKPLIPSASAPFSAGPTGCIGQQLAMMELSLIVARLLWRFDLRAPAQMQIQTHESSQQTGTVEYRMKDWFIGEGAGPWVQLV